MEFTSFIKIFTLVLGLIAFIAMMAWVFQGISEEDSPERRPLLSRLFRKNKR
jgi:hypothetical protein